MSAPIEDAVVAAARRSRQRRDLEARADFVRARLATALDTMNARRRRLLDPAEEIRLHPAGAVALGGAATLLLAAGVGVAAYRLSTRKARARRAQRYGWMSLVAHPERVAPKPPSFMLVLVEKSLSAAAAATLTVLAKHVVSRLLEETEPPARPVPTLAARSSSSTVR